MNKKLVFPLITLSLAQQAVHAHSSHSEGMQHASEHLWFVLVPVALWFAYSISKTHRKTKQQRGKRDQG